MNAQHGDEHEAVLMRIVSGDLPREAAEAAALLEACSTCRGTLAQLDEVTSSLGQAGDLERRVLEDAARIEAAPGEDRVAEIVRQHAHRQPRRIWPWAIAAAAAACLLLFFWPRETEGDRSDLFLGGPEHQDGLEPHGIVERWTAFRWRKPQTSPGGTYTISVWRADVPPGADPELVQGGIIPSVTDEVKTWLPSDELLSSLPRSIRWRVEAFDAFGSPVPRQRAEAEASLAQ